MTPDAARWVRRQTAGECALCEELGVVRVNGSWFCADHLDDGFRMTLRGEALEAGVDPDVVEERGVEMLEDLRRRAEEP